jgi:hypothetical protein
MPITTEWQGHELTIETKLAPRYLYSATETTLTIDGQPIGKVGGFSMTEQLKSTFQGQDGKHHVQLAIQANLTGSANYQLKVDGIPIAEGSTWPDNVFPAGLFVLLFYAFLGFAVTQFLLTLR